MCQNLKDSTILSESTFDNHPEQAVQTNIDKKSSSSRLEIFALQATLWPSTVNKSMQSHFLLIILGLSQELWRWLCCL